MKAAGAGFHMPPETFEVDMEHARSRDADGRIWYLAWRRLPGHTVCTACDVQSGVLMTQCSSRDLLRT